MTQKYFINLKKKDAKFELNKDNPYLSRFNYIIISKYHNSSILYTNENNKTKTTEEKLEVDQKGLDDIKEDSGYHDPIALNKLEYLNVPQDPKDFQLPNEWKSVVDGFNTDIGESSTPDESTLNSSTEVLKYQVYSIKPEEKIVEEELKSHLEESVKSLKEILENCGKANIEDLSECFKKLKISEILAKHKLTPKENLNLKESIEADVKESIKTSMIEKIGDLKVSEVLEMAKSVKDKLNIELKINPVDLAIHLFGYGLLIKSYDGFIQRVKIPKKVSPIHFETMKITSYYNRLFFASIMAPAIILSLNYVKSNQSLIKEVNFSPSSSTGISNTDYINKNIFWGLFAKLNIKSWVKFIIISIILIMGLISFNFPDFSYITFFTYLYKNLFVFYLKWLVLILGLIPITLNLMWMIILKLISKNKLPKTLYKIKYLQVLKESKENKVVYSYYYNRSIREVIFYIGILSTYFLFIYFFI